jgi:2-polyprenyl-3-methyl-5-hydroxy-6-metoxy-1,4-benzoquinol methylase
VVDVSSILTTGKDGYDSNGEFDRRTRAAVAGEPSEWGDPAELYQRDAVEVLSFIQDDYPEVARVLSRLEGYSILDLGCGYGRLSPFLSAFDCERYLGVERVASRADLALGRYASGVCDFKRADALDYRTDDLFDVVWTSNVMQHLLLPAKHQFAETAKAACAPAGRIIMREAGIIDGTLADAECVYRSSTQPKHMVPIPRAELERAFAPFKLMRLGGIVWQACATL